MGELAGKVAMLTGGGTGIGRGIALVMAREGATVICTDIVPGHAEETAAAVRAAGGVAEVLAQDVTKWDSCREVADKVLGSSWSDRHSGDQCRRVQIGCDHRT